MSPIARRYICRRPGFPRVSGDEPDGAPGIHSGICFPRVSGNEPITKHHIGSSATYSLREWG